MSPAMKLIASVAAVVLTGAASQAWAGVTVALTAPANGATVNAPVTLSATASATEGYIVSKVEFLDGSTLVGTDTTSPYSVSWNNAPAGSHTLTAKATATKSGSPNQTATSSPRTITVNAPPVVSLTSPPSGAIFAQPANIAASATASDSDGTIANVKIGYRDYYWCDGGEITLTAPPFNYAFTPVTSQCGADGPNGEHTYTIYAQATDNRGATAPWSELMVTVTEENYFPPNVSLTSPAPNATFTAPANITITANASDSDGTIAKVEFYKGATLITTLTAAPSTYNWTNVAAGSYSLTAVATDNSGATRTSAPVAITVTTNGASVTVTSPSPEAVIASDNVTVSGTFTGPSNTGIAVNGVVAAIDGNTFVAVSVPLQTGANTLTATLTTLNNQTATQTLSVTSTGPAAIEVSASPTQGVAPLAVTFTVNNSTRNKIQSVLADFTGSGSFVNLGAVTTASNTYSAGTFQAGFIVNDSAGVQYTQTITIVVQDVAQIDQMLQTAWWGFTTVLSAQDTNQALQYFNAQAQQTYGPVISALQPNLPQIVASFSAPQLVSISGDVGEYALSRTINGVDQVFFIYFARDPDGVWRLDSM
jgi:hypothetical protein